MYLRNHNFPTRYDFVASCMLLYCTISDHPVTESIIVKVYIMRELSWPSLLILYGPVIYNKNLSNEMAF